MKGCRDNIRQLPVAKENFRRILYTGTTSSRADDAAVRQEIGEEVHDDRDQVLRVEDGSGEVRINGATNPAGGNFAVIVTIPAGRSRPYFPNATNIWPHQN